MEGKVNQGIHHRLHPGVTVNDYQVMTVETSSFAIEVDRLRVRRGRREVLPGLTCAIGSGRVTGLLGPSGSGKTTLMRAIVGVQRCHGGSVSVLGRPAGRADLRSTVAYMTQSVSVYRDISVLENVRYFASLVGAEAARAEEVVEEVGLGGQRSQLAGNLSGGQLSRVSLGCALVGDPLVLILDEPTVGQDPVLREELWAGFRRRAADGATVLVSSHVMDEATRCEDLLLLREGELIAHDHPATLLERTGAEDFDSAFLDLIHGQDQEQ